jgi:hypothetical protein
MDVFSIINSKVGIASRYFRWNDGTTYASVPVTSLTSDFKISFLVEHNGGGAFCVFGSSAAYLDRFLINNDGSFSYITSTSGQQLLGGADAVAQDELHFVEIIKTGSTTEIFVDGSSVVSGTPTGSMAFDQIFRTGLLVRGVGTIANLRVEDSGTLSRLYRINDNSDVMTDIVSAENGTVVGSDSDYWGLFTAEGGNWQGAGLTVPPWTSTTQLLTVA